MTLTKRNKGAPLLKVRFTGGVENYVVGGGFNDNDIRYFYGESLGSVPADATKKIVAANQSSFIIEHGRDMHLGWDS